jgi:hypothetical protein
MYLKGAYREFLNTFVAATTLQWIKSDQEPTLRTRVKTPAM